MSEPIYLRAGNTSLLLATTSPGALPQVLHWGADLGDRSQEEIAALVDALRLPEVSDQINGIPELTLLPDPSYAWYGTPGFEITLSDGTPVTRLAVIETKVELFEKRGVSAEVLIDARDADHDEGPTITVELHMFQTGLIRARASTTAHGKSIEVGALTPMMPVPHSACEIMDFTGRHLRERHEQRLPFAVGTHLRESRRGRTSLQSATLMIAGTRSFSYRSGQVWATHVGWSGDQRIFAERGHTPHRVIGGGELLHPGEALLASGQSYQSPWTYFARGEGLDAIAAQFHSYIRNRAGRSGRPRPVTLNTWEAVYFDQDFRKLEELVERAAHVGAERFVLDDGWFGSRRSDRSGLGDWTVSKEVWPDGLMPLIDRVHDLGMEFGLWVEPEMVNPDSDLAREHPDWILGQIGRDPITARHQQVLDLSNPAAYDHVRSALLALVDEYPIAYLKWDHNRDLLEPISRTTRRNATHAQTLATYRLMTELKQACPGLEIESCSSGGGRVDLGVLDVCDRIWTSDCIDPVERVQIQRGTGLLVPPELLGAHVGAEQSHTTGRATPIEFRLAIAFSGHLGIECDLTLASNRELEELRHGITFWKAWRKHLSRAVQVNADDPNDGRNAVGFISENQRLALYIVSATETTLTYPPPRIRFAGLDPNVRYRITPAYPIPPIIALPPWLKKGVTMASGKVLTDVGLASPVLLPTTALILQLEAVDLGGVPIHETTD